jgi:hypothetical protein
LQTDRLRKSQAHDKQQSSVIAEKDAIIQYHVNEKGQLVAQKEAAEIRSKDLENSYPKIYETLKRDMDINAKNLKAYIQNEFAAHGTGQGSVTTNNYYDTATHKQVRFRDFHMSDGYLTFDTRLYDSLQTSLYRYTYSDTAKTAISAKRKWFLGKEQLFATTVFSNPSSKITGTTNILVNNYRDKRFSVSLSAGYGLVKVGDEVHTGWFAGPSVSYSLFKF